MFDDLLAACALVLVLEGILPFASPRMVRKMWESVSTMPDRNLRLLGLFSMLAGVILLYFIRQS